LSRGSARLDLKEADGVGLLQHLVHRRIVFRQVRKIDDTTITTI